MINLSRGGATTNPSNPLNLPNDDTSVNCQPSTTLKLPGDCKVAWEATGYEGQDLQGGGALYKGGGGLSVRLSSLGVEVLMVQGLYEREDIHTRL